MEASRERIYAPPDELVQRCQARADELGWSLSWLVGDTERVLSATDPAEPEGLGRLEITLGPTQTWASAAAELGLVEDIAADEGIDLAALQAAVEDELEILLRLKDTTVWAGPVFAAADYRPTGRDDESLPTAVTGSFVRVVDGERHPNRHCGKLFVEAIRELVVLRKVECEHCLMDFQVTPYEQGAECPHCGEWVGLTDDRCETCLALKPCACDIAAAGARDKEEKVQRAIGDERYSCERRGHVFTDTKFCIMCGLNEEHARAAGQPMTWRPS